MLAAVARKLIVAAGVRHVGAAARFMLRDRGFSPRRWAGPGGWPLVLGASVALTLLATAPAEDVNAAGQVEVLRVPADRSVSSHSSRDAGARPDSLLRARRQGELSQAEYALVRARSLFALKAVRRRHGLVRRQGEHAATPVLIALATQMDGLDARRRRRAASLLARPTDGRSDQFDDGYRTRRVRRACISKAMCVHWVERTVDAPPPADVAPANGRPDQVDATIATIGAVWDTEVTEMGFRAPLSDRGRKAGQGPNRGTDVYLADLGRDGMFGYCAADPAKGRKGKKRKRKPALTAAAYCVIDDDFSTAQFPPPGPSGLDALRVTLAHELFHAVQFAYEYSEDDQWLKEGTAAWIESQVFDSLDANLGYLPESPLLQPEIPLDAHGSSFDAHDFEYGAWIFWQFLSEYYDDPGVIRRVWESAAARSRRRNRSALEATKDVVTRLDAPPRCIVYCSDPSFSEAFAEFGFWNSFYDLTYEEGDAYADRLGTVAPWDAAYLMGGPEGTVRTGKRTLPIDHLATRQVLMGMAPAAAGDYYLTFNVAPAAGFSGDPQVTLVYDLIEDPGRLYVTAAGGGGYTGAFPGAPVNSLTLLLHNAGGTKDGQRFEYSGELEPRMP